MAKEKSEYTVVARRFRPQQFDDLIGQETAAQALRNAIESGRVAHAYLFTGARGVGKTSAARILAKALNCTKGPTPTPCDKCSSCQAIATGEDIDVREIDGASNRGIDDVRALRQDVSTRPTRGRYKIYIIDEVHMLTKESFNALLKTLEEPPPHVKFIFATTDVQKVPITILSRCQRFDFRTISTDRIAKQLRLIVSAEKMKADDDALEIIARRAGGSMRDAQSLLDQMLAFSAEKLTTEAVQQLLGVAGPERVQQLVAAIQKHDAKEAVERLQEMAEAGVQLGELLDQLIEHWRDLMLVSAAGKDAQDLFTPERYRDALQEQAKNSDFDTVLAGLDILMGTKNRLRFAGHAATLLQMAVIRLCRLQDLASVSQLAAWLGQGGVAPGSGRPAVGPKTATGTPVALPEGKKKPEPTATVALTSDNVSQVWAEVLVQVGGILAGNAQRSLPPAISAPKTLVLSFPPEYNGAYEHCSNPINIQRLEEALRARTGQPWTVRLEKSAATGRGQPATGAAMPTMAPQRARPQDVLSGHPLLQRVVDTMSGRLLGIDPGFGEQPAAPEIETPTGEE